MVQIYSDKFVKPIVKKGISINNDMKILSCAIEMQKKYDIVFITNDLSLKHIALLFFNEVKCVADEVDDYCGFKEFILDDDETINDFYQNPTTNTLDLLPNEYAVIRDKDESIIDRVCWTGETYRPLKFSTFQSKWFNVKPMKGDVYQQFVADSFMNNKIIVIQTFRVILNGVKNLCA